MISLVDFFFFWTSLVAQMVSKVSACNTGDPGSIPGLGRSSGEGNGNPLQYYCLENPRDGGAWQGTVHGIAKSRTRLSGFFNTQPCFYCWIQLNIIFFLKKYYLIGYVESQLWFLVATHRLSSVALKLQSMQAQQCSTWIRGSVACGILVP